MLKEEAVKRIEKKKIFISTLCDELKDILPKVSIEKCTSYEKANPRVRAKTLMKMIRRESIDLENLMYKWYEIEETEV